VVSQRTQHSRSDSSGNEGAVYQAMLKEMQIHRGILERIRIDLPSMNLRNITDKEVKRYQGQVNTAIGYVVNSKIEDSNNMLMIRRFVKTVKELERLGNLIIRKFNLALSRWEDYQKIRDQQRRDAAEERYEERLDECRTELINLLAQFKNF
jgi:hypothetical protein